MAGRPEAFGRKLQGQILLLYLTTVDFLFLMSANARKAGSRIAKDSPGGTALDRSIK